MKKNALISMLAGEVKIHIMWWHKDHMTYQELRGEIMAWAMDRRLEDKDGFVGVVLATMATWTW